MNYKLEKYTGKTYMAPSGALYTPERIKQDFEAIDVFPHVIQTDSSGEMCWGVYKLSALRDQHDIPAELSEDEAIAALETILNTPQPVDTTPSAEERIAAALEYQNLVNL